MLLNIKGMHIRHPLTLIHDFIIGGFILLFFSPVQHYIFPDFSFIQQPLPHSHQPPLSSSAALP